MSAFASSLGSLSVTVGAKIDGFEKAMGTVSQRLNAVDREAARAFSGFEKLGDRLSSIGVGLTAAITLPLAGAGAAAVKLAADFELGMRQVTSLLGGVTQREFGDLSQAVLKLSRDMGIDAVKASNALYEAISAGVPKENAIEFIAVASKAAIAGVTDTRVAVDALTTIIAAYNLSFSDATKVSDALFQAVNVGKFTFEQLASSIGPAAAQAKNLGVSYEELLAATSTLSITSGGVSIAVTQIESAFRALLQPTNEMQAALKGIGFESGSAAVQTLGFEGTLQRLRERTGGSAEAFNALFGRIEGYNAAIGLTGDRSQAAARDLETLRNSTGAAERAFREIDQTTQRQFERLTSELKGTAIELGTALLPAVNDLLKSARPLVDAISEIVKWFVALPQPIQGAALGVAAFAVALGPAILGVGQLTSAIASLLPALTSVIGNLTAWAGTLATASTAGATAGAAMTSLGIALKAIPYVALAAGLAYVLNKLLETETATDNLRKASDKKREALERLNEKYREQQIALGRLAPQIDDAREKVLDFVRGLNAAPAQISKMATSVSAAAEASKKFREAVDAEKSSIQQSTERAKVHEQALRELGMATEDTQRKGRDFASALPLLSAEAERLARKYEENVKNLVALKAAIREGSTGTDIFAQRIKVMGDSADEVGKRIEQLGRITFPGYINAIDEAAKHNKALEEAFKTVGRTSTASLEEIVKKNRAAYELISRDARSSTKDILAAWIALREAEIALAKDRGEKVSQAEKASLERMKQQLGVGHKEQEEKWRGFAKQVSLIVNDLGRDLAAATVKFLKGLFGFDDYNRSIREAMAVQSAELAKREQDQAGFLARRQAEYEAWAEQQAAELERETQDLRSALAQRESEFQEYAASVASTLDEFRGKEQQRLAAELAELTDKLREKEAAYQQYQAQVAESEVQIRRNHSEQLEQQVADLRRTLRDRVQSYDDYVEEANVRLKRIGKDLAETLKDAQRSAGRKQEDEVKRHNRRVEDLNDDLRDAERRGDRQRAEEIRRQLQREEQDHRQTVQRISEDLAEQAADARRRAEEQTEDARRNLEQRTRDHQEFLAENALRQQEARDSHASRLAEELADLQKNLDQRTAELLAFRASTAAATEEAEAGSAARMAAEEAKVADSLVRRRQQLEAYRADIEAKIEALAAKFAEKAEQETAKLKQEIDARISEYERFRAETLAKMEQLERDLKGPLDRIKELFTSVFASVSDAILRVASEAVIGALIGALKGPLTEAIEAVWKKILALFGLVPSGRATEEPAGGTPEGQVPAPAPAPAPGPSGQVAQDVISGITAAAAVASFIQGFQIEKGLDAIEKEVRYTQIYTREILEKGVNVFQAHLPMIHQRLVEFLTNHAWRIHDVHDRLQDIMGILRDETNSLLRGIDDHLLAAEPSREVHIHLAGAVFQNRSDIDYAVEQMSRNLR